MAPPGGSRPLWQHPIWQHPIVAAVGTVTVTSVFGTSRRQLKTVKATKDTTTPIRLDVTGVRTLEFACSPNEGYQGFFNVVLGNAVLHR